MNFQELNNQIKQQFDIMQQHNLFRLNITGHQIWDAYITGFKPEENPIFRDPNSTEHTCNNDKNFIKRYSNIVAITENLNIITMFDIDVINTKYSNAIESVKSLLHTSTIQEVFFETFNELNSLNYQKVNRDTKVFQLGVDKVYKKYTQDEVDKFGVVNTNDIYTFHQFHVFLEKKYVDSTGKSVEAIMSNFRDSKNVFKRGLDEISESTLKLVIDLIKQGSLLDGTSHLTKVENFLTFKITYDGLVKSQQDNYAWLQSYNLPIAKFRNELIGTLCQELTEGKELNDACQTWNKRVDPANYMKAKTPITQRQIEEAKKFVEENDYEESFNRRFATISDINVSEILHSNIGNNKLKTASVFDNVKSTSTQHKRAEFDKIEVVAIEKFMSDILPSCTSVEAFVTNEQKSNFVALTKAVNNNSKSIFKWTNNYSWTFNGNLAGKSQIKENVKLAGGKIEALLRCSLQWNDEDTPGILDYDLHCKTPFDEICYSSKKCYSSNGWLDVDMINPVTVGIENIIWQKQLPNGSYEFFVKHFSGSSNKGFKCEIEFEGNTFNYYYPNSTINNQDVKVATITAKDGNLSIIHHLAETSNSSTIWNIEIGKFHKVNLISLTPNHWSTNNIGNKHYLFMLEDCKSDTELRSFHNENLNSDLLQHKKVTEVLANQCMIQPIGKQLAGLGFNSTVKDDLIVKLQGSHKRTIRIQF